MDASDDIIAVLNGEDELGAVLRGHIHIESHVEAFIKSHLIRPEYLDSMNLEYHQKVKLASALGLDDMLKTPLMFLGTLRNKFSHDLNTRLGKQELKNFYKAFPTDAKELIHSAIRITSKKMSGVPKVTFDDFELRMQFSLLVISLEGGISIETKRVREKHA